MAKRKQTSRPSEKLFADEQIDMFEKSYEEQLKEEKNRPVECLGITFENDEKRREYFLEKLRGKLKDPEFRKIEGFPIGEDEDILAISDPPYYTACPNPFIVDFIKHYGKPYDPTTDAYQREPFAADVSEGKNDPIYNAHTYHTKVPHKAIMRYILHYTEPGDVVFDGFCGTGMTGVATQLCGDKITVESLGYKVDGEGIIYQQDTDENGKTVWKPFSKLSARRAVLNDLSPSATFITYNYNAPLDVEAFGREAKRILAELEEECGWMYETLHSDGRTKGRIDYTVWSDVFNCPQCGGEVVFWDIGVDKATGYRKGKSEDLSCSSCGAKAPLDDFERASETIYDQTLGYTGKRLKRIPVLIEYSVAKRRFKKKPDQNDMALIRSIERKEYRYWFPLFEMMFKGTPKWGDSWRSGYHFGISHVHHFYLTRSLHMWACLMSKVLNAPLELRSRLLFWTQSVALGQTLLNRYLSASYSQVNRYLKGTLYIAPFISEVSPWYALSGKIRRLTSTSLKGARSNMISCGSAAYALQDDCSVDYLFVDPPFGSNLHYSELNFIWESWLKVFTNNIEEGVVSPFQGKRLAEYQNLMKGCFAEYFRILKPGHWMTVEFHNSKNAVWNAIQESILRVGFVISDVRVLDKKQMTMQQMTSAGAVKQDLVISAYKPNDGLEDRFKLTAGTEDGVWDFVRTHLKQLPIFVSKDGQAEVIAERQNYLLFDRMVAFHVQHGVTIPLSAAEFYAGLEQRFPPRSGMYFLPDQAAEYDMKRMTVKEVLQLQLFVSDEASAIRWLKQQLTKKPQTFQDIHPQFLKEIGGWQKHEKPLELSELLRENFLLYDGKGEVSSQIHSYLSSNFKELRNLTKDDPALKAKAKDRWYVPDPNKAGDLEKLRERALMREFQEYRESKQKRLKVFRLEAVRSGFKKAWQERDYVTIIAVARKIPEKILQEDPKLLMWYDQALTRTGG